MEKILMVCPGNICRSPLAEGIMLKLTEEQKLDMMVDSAGTSIGGASRTVLPSGGYYRAKT